MMAVDEPLPTEPSVDRSLDDAIAERKKQQLDSVTVVRSSIRGQAPSGPSRLFSSAFRASSSDPRVPRHRHPSRRHPSGHRNGRDPIRIPRANPDSEWKHDLYQGEVEPPVDSVESVDQDSEMKDAHEQAEDQQQEPVLPENEVRAEQQDIRDNLEETRGEPESPELYRLFLSNLHFDVIRDDLVEFLSSGGVSAQSVRKVDISFDEAGRSMGEVLLVVAGKECAEQVHQLLTGQEWHGQAVRVSEPERIPEQRPARRIDHSGGSGVVRSRHGRIQDIRRRNNDRPSSWGRPYDRRPSYQDSRNSRRPRSRSPPPPRRSRYEDSHRRNHTDHRAYPLRRREEDRRRW